MLDIKRIRQNPQELIDALQGQGLIKWSENSLLRAEVDGYYNEMGSAWNDLLRDPPSPGKPQMGTI